MTDNTFKPFHITENPFCSAQTLLPNGQGIIVGGNLQARSIDSLGYWWRLTLHAGAGM